MALDGRLEVGGSEYECTKGFSTDRNQILFIEEGHTSVCLDWM